jgi:nitroreductase
MVRSFSPEPLASETLDGVLRLALRAPAAGNTGGWDAVVLEGPDQTEPFWAATTTADWRARSPRWPGLRRAPVVVALFSSPAAYLARYGEPDKSPSGLSTGVEAWPVPYWDVDAGMAALLLLLGAADSGLGACFLGNFRGEAPLRAALGVPGGFRYVGAVLIGHPDADDPPTVSARRPRRSPEKVFHQGRW